VDPAGVGIRVVSVAKNNTDPAFDDDPAVQQGVQILQDAGLDPFSGTAALAFLYATVWVEAMRNAAEMPGGLNRVTFQTAMWNMDYENPYYLDGSALISDGANDAYLVEAGRVDEYQLDADGVGTLVPASDLIVVEGQLGHFQG